MPKYITFKNYSLKEFFSEVKNKTGLSNNKLAKSLNVCRSMIYNYLKNECKFKYDYFLKLCQLANISQNKYSFDIKEFKERYDIKIPKPNQKLAEFIGTMLGDGNLCKPNSSRNFYFLRIGNHTIDDKEYRDYLQKLFFYLFKINLRSYDYPHTETMLDCGNRIVFEIIEKYGFPRGIKRKIM